MSPRQKEEWIEVTEAAAIISENSAHTVSVDYVRLLANQGKIRRMKRNHRENLYLKNDAVKIKVRQRKRPTGFSQESELPNQGEAKAA